MQRGRGATAIGVAYLMVAEGLLIGNSLGAFPSRAGIVYIVGLLQLLLVAGGLFFQVLMSFLLPTSHDEARLAALEFHHKRLLRGVKRLIAYKQRGSPSAGQFPACKV